MAKSQIKVATIVGSSTTTAWSQTYHAGGVTAVVSVRPKEGQISSSLSLVGKDLLNTFESEYFTLETKNLASIKEAVSVTYNKSKDTHDISLIVSAVIQNAIYVVLAGPGKIILIRKGNLATLLGQKEEDVLSASGFLESGDVVALVTLPFEEKVPSHVLLNTLTQNSVADSAEILSPTIHKEQDGAAAAMLLSYVEEAPTPEHIEKSPQPQQSEPVILGSEATPESNKSDVQQAGYRMATLQASMTNYNKMTIEPIENEQQKEDDYLIHAPVVRSEKKRMRLTHRQKIFLTIAVILVVVFVGAIYFSLQKKQSSQNTALFSQLYTPAEKKYEEGQSLQDLNSALAHDDYTQAQQMLESAKGKFPTSSSEEKQILALLDKVNAALGGGNSAAAAPTQTANATKVDATTSPFLSYVLKNPSANYFAQDDSNFYFADNSGITKSPKSGGKDKQIIQNGGDWKTLGGFDTYLGNMYVLYTADGIDKYPVAAAGYGNKIAYFSGSTPDLSKATSIAIDSSVWILTSDGKILKFTKGSEDTFTMTGLNKPLSSPTKLVTTSDDANVYILDNGNSRLVELKKDGTFIADYTNPVIKSAMQLDVNETAKKAYLLSGGNVYEVDLK